MTTPEMMTKETPIRTIIPTTRHTIAKRGKSLLGEDKPSIEEEEGGGEREREREKEG